MDTKRKSSISKLIKKDLKIKAYDGGQLLPVWVKCTILIIDLKADLDSERKLYLYSSLPADMQGRI